MGYCNASDRDLGTCPYLKAIGEIAKLVAENGKYEDGQEKLKAWIADYIPFGKQPKYEFDGF